MPASTIRVDDVTAVELTDDPDALATILPDDAEVPELPPVPEGVRRLAWVRVGCGLATVELWVDAGRAVPALRVGGPPRRDAVRGR